jgi:hypothetical protein
MLVTECSALLVEILASGRIAERLVANNLDDLTRQHRKLQRRLNELGPRQRVPSMPMTPIYSCERAVGELHDSAGPKDLMLALEILQTRFGQFEPKRRCRVSWRLTTISIDSRTCAPMHVAR